jgi:crotonobetainyl-CoA:carnitine CoA-transferase CaiB-like acyl-CoA transferase
MNLTHQQLQSFLDPFYRTYTCRDGRSFYVVSVSHVTDAERALKVLGVWDDLVAAGIPCGDPYLPIRDWPNGIESTIRAHPVVEPWTSRISSRMAEAFLTKDSTEWERLFGEAGAPGAAHRTTQEWLNFSHPREPGLLVEVSDPNYGRMVQPGPIAWPDHGGHRSARRRPRGEADMLVAERKPEAGLARRGADHRQTVGQGRPRAAPGRAHRIAEFCYTAREQYRRIDLCEGGGRVTRGELDASGERECRFPSAS